MLTLYGEVSTEQASTNKKATKEYYQDHYFFKI